MRPTRAEINLTKLAENFRVLRRFVASNVKIMAMVKADAYGHGAVRCSQILQDEGADWFGVVTPEEAFELRKNGIEKPILTLQGFWRGQEKTLIENNITPAVFNFEQAESLNNAAAEMNLSAKIHVKIDTGMNRLGIRFDEAENFAERLKNLKNLEIEGLMTHFASADDAAENEFTALQTKHFDDAAQIFRAKGFNPTILDLANSPATLDHCETWAQMVRIGGALYGIGGDIFGCSKTFAKLQPIFSLKTEIMSLKNVYKGETVGYSRTFRAENDLVVAAIPIGYRDGLPRQLSNKGHVIVRGEFAPIVGRVSMDVVLIDVTKIPQVQLNDEVILIGKDCRRAVSTEDWAQMCGTISYQITCGITARVPKIFV